MTELNQVFDGDLTERVFLILSAIFAILYAGGILFMQRASVKWRWTASHGKIATTVCTENLNPDVMVMKSAKDRA